MQKALPYVLGALLLLGVGAGIALVAGGNGDDEPKSTTGAGAATTATTPAANVAGPATTLTVGPDASRYKAQVSAIRGRLNATANKLPSARQFGAPAFGNAILTVIDETNAIADDIGALQPPEEVAGLHASVLRQLQVLEDQYRRLRRASNANDLNGAIQALGATSAALDRVNKAIGRILNRL